MADGVATIKTKPKPVHLKPGESFDVIGKAKLRKVHQSEAGEPTGECTFDVWMEILIDRGER